MTTKTQQEHLKDLKLSFETLYTQFYGEEDTPLHVEPNVAESLRRLSENINGLDLRLINDELAHRVIEGSEVAVRALASKSKALSNRDVAATPDGLKIPYEDVKAFLYAAHHMLDTHIHTQFFPGTLSLVAKMLEVADDDEKKVLLNLAAKARVQATS